MAFPTWPPPSGGAPVLTPEMGPVLNPYPYGTAQNQNISIANPAPPFSAMLFPDEMDPHNGQNQGSGYPGLPAWPWPAKMTVLPDKASPSISQIP